MTNEANGQATAMFWVLAIFFLLFNAIGLFFYYMQMTITEEMLAANFTPEQQEFMRNIPVWATSAYALAVNSGVLASILLLLRKAWAVPLYIFSFVCVLIQDLDAFLLSDGIGVWGTSGLYLPITVIVVCIAEIWYSRKARADGIIS